MRSPARTSLAVTACALALAGCASSISTSRFKGEEHEVAQTIANLQSDTSAPDQKRVCENDLAQSIVKQLNQSQGGCERVIKTQQTEIDPGLEVTVESVHITGAPAARTATATVKSTFEGKRRISTLELVKEGGKWKVSGLH
jgi:hypothetical protein